MTTPPDPALLRQALNNARRALLNARNPSGHWEGNLSSSALSTATAVVALTLYERAMATNENSRDPSAQELRTKCQRLALAGLAWLRQTQNADGGWGDTTLSLSNISTTTLVWAALELRETPSSKTPNDDHVRKAEAWLRAAAGSLEPAALSAAIAKRYGRDRTFSVPILTHCALAGRLGSDPWRFVPQLPFEIAALPQRWFKWLRLPVVSYALPALIAIGQVRHRLRPTRNPLTRAWRTMASRKTLRVLQRIQPAGGGFLEATPLTSFVSMSLIGAGLADHAVVKQGIDFLLRSVRGDGSWPIDTNLATWATTWSINALALDRGALETLPLDERQALRDWLLGQQYREVHLYTGADPGGWAWTDLPGGVPDADDTAGALIALKNLGPPDATTLAAVQAAVGWLLDLQNRDGGMPTFCRGWGALPFDRSGADLAAHALHAWAAWASELPIDLQLRIEAATRRSLKYLARVQRPDGAWSPLWFGNQHEANEENLTYGTSRVLAALTYLDETPYPDLRPLIASSTRWLLRAQNADGSWGGAAGIAGSMEETGLAVVALAEVARNEKDQRDRESTRSSIARGAAWIIEQTEGGQTFAPSPIGFYFAKLWYFERLYPQIWSVAGLASATPASGD